MMDLRTDERGLTLTELLVGVLVLIIAMALVVPAVFSIRRELRQRELDSKAETICVAVQNEMTKLRSGGMSHVYAVGTSTGVVVLPDSPSDRKVVVDASGDVEGDEELGCVSSVDRDSSGSAASYLMGSGVCADELRLASWVIEFDSQSSTVYAVWYSEDEDLSDYVSNWSHYDGLRRKDARLSDGARVGYYGGDSLDVDEGLSLRPTVSVDNGERLVLVSQCTLPSQASSSARLVFDVTLSDDFGHSVTQTYGADFLHPVEHVRNTYFLRLVLDDLSSEDTRFANVWGEGSSRSLSERLVSGTRLDVSVRVRAENDWRISPKVVSTVTNSLFADSSNDVRDASGHVCAAHVACGRHLQNLGELAGAGSFGDVSHVRSAEVLNDIDFGRSTASGSWWSTYCSQDGSYFAGRDDGGAARFAPIEPSGLSSFDGKGHVLHGLNIRSDANAGLFASVGDFTFRDVDLSGTRVVGKGSCGALVAEVAGDVDVDGVRVYLDRAAGDLVGAKVSSPFVSGATSGGLFGSVRSGASLGVLGSFASTIVSGTGCAGGLVGAADGSVRVSESYADCYVSGADVSGLVGKAGNASSVRVDDSYAVGYLYGASRSSGLVSGRASSLSRCYSACAFMTDSGSAYSTCASAGAVVDTFFREVDGVASIERTVGFSSSNVSDVLDKLGSRFVGESVGTHAYCVLGQSLGEYPYPRVRRLPHYGDWEADFVPASLVYYERYRSGAGFTTGFAGAGVDSTLDDADAVVGDGYGIVYRLGEEIPESVSVTFGDDSFTIERDSSPSWRVSTATGTYVVYPLPTRWMNGDVSSSFYTRVTVSGSGGEPAVWWVNPHFASTQVMSASSPTVPETVFVRTSRQLHLLSGFYDGYADMLRDVVFEQGRDIDFAPYDWADFWQVGVGSVVSQGPIGSAEHPFTATYDGMCHVISSVSFVSDSDVVGLFGHSEGTLRNVVLANDFVDGESLFGLVHEGEVSSNRRVSMGVLVGHNEAGGLVENCACAGYYLGGEEGTVYVYANGHMRVGGLVGTNAGVVLASSAETPLVRSSALDADVALGGLVGENADSGEIRECYAIGHVEVAYSRGGVVHASGFAGLNRGRIASSYAATSLIANGESSHTYAFSPLGGDVQDCRYLDDGTYLYLGDFRAYESDEGSPTSGEPVRRSALAVSSSRARFHARTDVDAYPYPAYVHDLSGAPVHYGDWQVDATLGSAGIFYWEEESGGANNGYHLTYLGMSEGVPHGGTTLCNAHDDGGSVVRYGYGYFVGPGTDVSSVTQSLSGGLVNSGDVVDAEAKASFETQLAGYSFFPYVTDVTSEGAFVWLDGGPDGRDGVWSLSYTNSDGRSVSYDFVVNPYFANAMSVDGGVSLSGQDGISSDYGARAGSDAHEYEVRCLEQLQYVNWNGVECRCDLLVTTDNYKQYPYLQYARTTTPSVQSRAAVEATRPPQSWRQSHDVVGYGNFTPIAGMATTCSNIDGTNYSNPLYAFFGGSYDGQSYAIKNVNIVSDAFTVGLFGVTAGANIRNIVMHGDGTCSIVRDTTLADGVVGEFRGAYAIGGLVAIAMDYGTSGTDNTISNCAVSGYNVIDRSTNQQGNGGAVIGGLIGIASVRLERCSAANSILIDCIHPNGHPKWGSYLRVGGLTGSVFYSVRDCYSGGSIDVSDRCRDEKPDEWTPTRTSGLAREKAAHIYAAGITACSYGTAVSNFTGRETGQPDGQAYFDNCYTYTHLPDVAGTVRAVTLVAGQGDRYNRTSRVFISNCYYLQSVRDAVGYEPDPGYFFSQNSSKYRLTDADVQAMLDGDLRVMCKIVQNQSAGGAWVPNVSTGLGYDELSAPDMPGRLDGSVWGFVTTTEGSSRIDGKYSFPSGRFDLLGKNYPFPAVVRQRDLTFDRDVFVHYGSWPSDGVVWERGMASMDLFSDMSSSGWAEREFRLFDNGAMDHADVTFSDAGIAELVGEPRRDGDAWVVCLRGLAEGATVVTADDGSSAASFTLDVTAGLNVSASPSRVVGYRRGRSEVALSATSANGGRDVTHDARLTWSPVESTLSDVTVEDGRLVIVRDEPGFESLPVLATYDYHGSLYRGSTFVESVTYGFFGLGLSESVTVGDRFCQADRSPMAGEVVGRVAYPSVRPMLPRGESGDFFVYQPNSDERFGTGLSLGEVMRVDVAFSVDGERYEASFAPDGTSIGDALPSGRAVRLSMGSRVLSDSAYSYLAGSVRYVGEGSPTDASVTVFVMSSDDAGSTYRLSLPVSLPSILVTFESGLGDGDSFVQVASGANMEMPSCPFVREGYTFVFWKCDEPGCQGHLPASAVDVSTHRTFVATWRPNTYTVVFDANGGEGSMEPVSCEYGVEYLLPSCSLSHHARSFAGWSTSRLGPVAYADGGAFSDLSADDGSEVVLYAHWEAEHTLTLDAPGASPERQSFAVMNQGPSALDGYVAPTMPGFSLVGWQTEPDGGNLVLDASGSFVGRVPGYTDGTSWLMFEDQTLYGVFEPKEPEPEFSLVANGVETAYPVSGFSDAYVRPERDGFELLGFYDGVDLSASKVLEADGTLAEGVSVASGDVLYARWRGVVSTILDDFTPTGTGNARKFVHQADVDFSVGETLEVVMDLSTGVSTSERENVLGFGKNISVWSGSQSALVYTWKIAGTTDSWLRFELLGTGARLTPDVDVRVSYEQPVTIAFTKDAVFCNGVAVGNPYDTKYAELIANLGTTTYQVGSAEGKVRSFASHYVIRVIGYEFG